MCRACLERCAGQLIATHTRLVNNGCLYVQEAECVVVVALAAAAAAAAVVAVVPSYMRRHSVGRMQEKYNRHLR